MDRNMKTGGMARGIILGVLCAVLAAAAVGCGKSGKGESAYRNDVSTEDLRTAAADYLGENYWPNMALGAEELELMTGIPAGLCEEYTAEMPMISTNVDTLMIFKAKDGKLEELKKAVNDYRERMVGDTMQYPMNLGKIQASAVKEFGNYVCYVQLGADTMEAEEEGEEAVVKQCKQVNEEVLGIIEGQLKRG